VVHAQTRFARQPTELQDLPARVPSILLAVLLGTLCVIAAIYAISQQTAFSEYLTQARLCVELNECPSRGGRTGGLPLFHGAVWIRLLAYSLRAGLDLTRVQSIVLGLWMLSIPITYVFLQRYLGLRAATLALGLYFPVILVGTDITDLTYTNLLPLPFALYYGSLLLFMEFRRIVFAAIASIALAAAVSAELGGIVMVPFHFLLVMLAARRKILAVAACGLAFAIPFCWDSMDAAREIVIQVPTLRFAVGLAILGGVVALVARMSTKVVQLASMSPADRARVVMTAALIYATATIWLGNLLLSRGVPAPRYFLPASFPFLYLVAERMRNLPLRPTIVVGGLECVSLVLLPLAPHALEIVQVPVAIIVTLYAVAMIPVTTRARLRGRSPASARALWPSVAICLCAIAVAVGDIMLIAKRGAAQTFTLAEVEQIVPRLYAAGYTYPELLASLRGPAADDLLPLLTERDPSLFTKPPPLLLDPNFSLLVIKLPKAALARTQGIVAAVPIDDSRSAVVIRGERSYLDWIRMRRCIWTDDQGRASYSCAEPRTDRPLRHNWPYVDFGDAVPVASTGLPDRGQVPRIHFEVPVRARSAGAVHIVRTTNEWPATWRIARVRGVEVEGEVPGVEIRLPGTGASTGVVEFELIGGLPGDLRWVWIPPVIEVAQENEHVLEPFRGVR
jgi:hypothetical protein